ncbi:hypothetical protein ABMA27_010149 [Loxostege sticticalis]|uniref:Reverse transcriptase n=1 Tax=Loxostege sticticalis TaxID=481309 RepID=A0ABR3H4S0_LOXSC
MARGTGYPDAARRATAGVATIVQRIRELGLEVALEKSEALCFHRARQAPPVGAHLVIGGVRTEVGRTMKYLGLTLDSRWNFEAHFKRLAPKLLGTAGALSRLLPNLGGPSATCRRLYMGVVRSMALYGAPVWYDALSSGTIRQLSRVQRVLAVRAIRGYRSISTDAALLLAGTPPWDLDAKVLAAVYEWRGDLRSQDLRPAPREIQAERDRLDDLALEVWQCRLASGTAGRRTVMTIRPVLKEWSEEKWQAVLTFCEAVVSQKEAAEREREASADAPTIRRRLTGRRRRQFNLLMPLLDGPRTTDSGEPAGR